MRALLVGAGAVGQVYAYHLQQGGAEVGVLVREKHAGAARRGFRLYALNRRRKRRKEPLQLSGLRVHTDAESIGPDDWDAVFLCVSSTALRQPWLDELLPRIGNATLVMLQPGIEDRAYVLERFDEARLVGGLISIVAYPTPLPGESWPEPGMAFWFPPLVASQLSGPAERVTPLVETFRRGGQPMRRVRDVAKVAGFPTALMMPHLTALEAAGWRFAEVARGDWLKLARRASAEAMVIVASRRRSRPPLVRHLIRPWTLKLAGWLAPKLLPFDLEVYLEAHFTKVGDQTRLFMDQYIELGREADLPVEHLSKLARALPARRGRSAAAESALPAAGSRL